MSFDEDPLEQLFEARVVRRLRCARCAPHGGACARTSRRRTRSASSERRSTSSLQNSWSYVTRGERVLHADRVGLRAERALQDRQRLVLLPVVEHSLADDLREVLRRQRRTQLHLAELGDHLEATDLAVHFARARQCLEIVGMELPRALIEPERAFALWNHILDERLRARTVAPTVRAWCPKLRAPSRAHRSFASNPATDAGVPEAACAYPSAVYPPAIAKETTPLILNAFLSRRASALGHPTRRKALRNSMAPRPTNRTGAVASIRDRAANVGSVDDERSRLRQPASVREPH